jgi:ribonuclease BN (tRNA processing enzyme)
VPHGKLHAKPSAVGYTAHQSGAKRLLLTHVMPPMENELEQSLAIVRSAYDGRIDLAHDLETYQIGT